MIAPHLAPRSLAALLSLALALPAAAEPPPPPPPPPPPAPPEALLLEPGSVALLGGKRGHLGVELLDLTEELRHYLGAPKDAGVLVSRLAAGGPAAAAGVKVGDVVTSAGGQKVASAFDLARAVRGKKKGEGLPLELVRDRKATSLSVTVGEREGGAVELRRLAVLADGEEEPLVRIDREQLRRIVERAREGARRVEVEVERRDGKRREMEQRLLEMERRLQEMEQRLQDRAGR